MAERTAPPPPDGFVRVRMTVAYDGTPFSGFATQPGVRTIQADLEGALESALRHPVTITCAGRTDKGVHAQGQLITFDADAGHFDAFALARAVNRNLNPSIAVRDVTETPPDFDARFSCIGRTYRYRILNSPDFDPLLANLAWHVREPLELASMRTASDRIIGLHDFASFSKRNKSKPTETYMRRVRRAEWSRQGNTVQLDITASSFTHQMVRSLVGLFVEIGRGSRQAVDMGDALAAEDRATVGSPAPPQGLVFVKAHF